MPVDTMTLRLDAPLARVAAVADPASPSSPAGSRTQAEEAYLRGVQDGEAAGGVALEAILTETGNRLRELLERIEAGREEVIRFAVELALALASRVVEREVEAGRYDLPGLAAGAFRRAEASGQAVLQMAVHPEDHEALLACLKGPKLAGLAGGTLATVADPSVPRCGVRLDTASGRIETCPAVRLSVLREAVRAW